MTFIRNLWRLFDRQVERSIAPEFVAHERHRHRDIPTPQPSGHMFLPPPRG